MFKFFITTIFSLCITTANADAGLSAGDKFDVHTLKGDLVIRCTEGNETMLLHASCHHRYLTPDNWSHFYTTDNVDADMVRLIYKDRRGKKRIKDEGFDPETKMSKKQFNLWIWTLFQRPILKPGHNDISYELTKDRSVVAIGSFAVYVNELPTRYCPDDSINSHYISDCKDPTFICRHYFKRHYDCQ